MGTRSMVLCFVDDTGCMDVSGLGSQGVWNYQSGFLQRCCFLYSQVSFEKLVELFSKKGHHIELTNGALFGAASPGIPE